MRDKFKNIYRLNNTDKLSSPSLLLYPEMVKSNLEKIKNQLGLDRLRPHIKTIKCKELIEMQLDAGIRKFKVATLKEASLLLALGVKDILIAYPLVAFQMEQFIQLAQQHPAVKLQGLVDHMDVAKSMNTYAAALGVQLPVFIDINLGMDRTGVAIQDLEIFYHELTALSNLNVVGFHGYDGHIRDVDLAARTTLVESYFQEFLKVRQRIESQVNCRLSCVFGGSNTFPFYKRYPFVECSPGTFMLWDWGYHVDLPEQAFDFAAILFSRIISKPAINNVCLDLGYKAVASENRIEHRVHLPEHPNWTPKFQSEEHLVMQVPAEEWEEISVGTAVYLIPYHICPTVAWYPFYQVVQDHRVECTWAIANRY